MRKFTQVHFMLVKIFSLIMSILMLISIVPFIIYCITASGYYHPFFSLLWPFLLVYSVEIVLAILLIKVFLLYNKASKMDNEFLVQNQGKILGWGIFYSIVMMTTIIGFIIALIFCIMANSYITDLKEGREEKTMGDVARNAGNAVKTGAKGVVDGTKEVFGIENQMDKQIEQLNKLKSMFDNAIISKDEYDAMRKKILNI